MLQKRQVNCSKSLEKAICPKILRKIEMEALHEENFKRNKGSKREKKNQVICYEWKKHGNFKLECPTLEKEKQKPFLQKEEKTHGNIGRFRFFIFGGRKDEIIFQDPITIQETYHELLTNSSILFIRKLFDKINIGSNKSKQSTTSSFTMGIMERMDMLRPNVSINLNKRL
ncbi:hypothetical protein CR513_61417, partial [Mucuna pruriens]